jgi:hypothetical protein
MHTASFLYRNSHAFDCEQIILSCKLRRHRDAFAVLAQALKTRGVAAGTHLGVKRIVAGE